MTPTDAIIYSAAGVLVAVGVLFLLFLAAVAAMRWKVKREEDAKFDAAYSQWVETRCVEPTPGQRWRAMYEPPLHVLRVTDEAVVYMCRDACRTVARQDWQVVVDTDNYYLLPA